MASNSLRGGKNIYGSKSLMSNWFEERLEPANRELAKQNQDQLPSKTAKTWSQTSNDFGAQHADSMKRAVAGLESDSFLQYQQIDPSEQYKTTSGSGHSHPDVQV